MTGGRWRGAVALLVLVGTLTGCAAPDEATVRAEEACRRVDPGGAALIAGYPTTVRQVRDRPRGPRVDASKAPFAGRPDGFAAWCWFERPDHLRLVVAALPTGEHLTFVEGDAELLEPDADGPVVP